MSSKDNWEHSQMQLVMPRPRSKKQCPSVVKCLTLLGLSLLLSLLITIAGITVYNYLMVENEFDDIDTQALQDNSDLNDALLNKIEQLENSLTAKIQELEETYGESLTNATLTIIELEEALNETERRLEEATDTISMLEDSNQMVIAALQTEVNMTKKQLDSATARITVLEGGVSDAQTDIASLNANKASKTTVNTLTRRVTDLEGGKVERTELEALSINVTLLKETTFAADRDIHRQLSDLVEIINNTNSTIEGELAKKADQQEVNVHSVQIANLTATSVDRASFEDLSNSVTQLRESTTREDALLHLELEALATGSLNLTHHIELQDLIAKFAATKANQTDLEALTTNVTKLAENTAQNEGDISQLSLDLANTKTSVNSALASKANQQSVDGLEDRVRDLESTTVEMGQFQQLNKTVASLKTGKADKSEVNKVNQSVVALNQITASEGKLQQELAERLANHTELSVETHDQLSASISSNDEGIERNQAEISEIRDEIVELRESGQQGLVPLPWLTISTSAILLLSYVY